jgi:uncharacterized protein (UPF0335 family)
MARDQLKAIFDRWQNLEKEKAALSEDLKELFVEAKSNGYEPKALRVAFRRRVAADKPISDADRELEALVETYLSALTFGAHVEPRARTREGKPSSDGALKSAVSRRNFEPARGAEEPAVDESGASRESTSLSRERDDAQPKGGMEGGSGPIRQDLAPPPFLDRSHPDCIIAASPRKRIEEVA